MSGTNVALREQTIWSVEADRSGERQSWRFDDKGVAEWVRDIARQYYLARCPTCGINDMLEMEVGVRDDPAGSAVVFVWCGFHDCEFAKRIVRTGRCVEHIPGLGDDSAR